MRPFRAMPIIAAFQNAVNQPRPDIDAPHKGCQHIIVQITQVKFGCPFIWIRGWLKRMIERLIQKIKEASEGFRRAGFTWIAGRRDKSFVGRGFNPPRSASLNRWAEAHSPQLEHRIYSKRRASPYHILGAGVERTRSWSYDVLRHTAVIEKRDLVSYTFDTPLEEEEALAYIAGLGHRFDSWQSHVPFAIEPVLNDLTAYDVTTYELHGMPMRRIEFYTFSNVLDTMAMETAEYVFTRAGGTYESKLHQGIYQTPIAADVGIIQQVLEDASAYVGVSLLLN